MTEQESRVVTIGADEKSALNVTVTTQAKKLGLNAEDRIKITPTKLEWTNGRNGDDRGIRP